MYFNCCKRLTIIHLLSDYQKGTSAERMTHYDLDERLMDIIESQNLGRWLYNHIDDGYFGSFFHCDDPDPAVKAIMAELKKFKPGISYIIEERDDETSIVQDTI